MARGFGLRKIQDQLQICDAQFFVAQQQRQNPDSGAVAEGLENLLAKTDVEIFKPHAASPRKLNNGVLHRKVP